MHPDCPRMGICIALLLFSDPPLRSPVSAPVDDSLETIIHLCDVITYNIIVGYYIVTEISLEH